MKSVWLVIIGPLIFSHPIFAKYDCKDEGTEQVCRDTIFLSSSDPNHVEKLMAGGPDDVFLVHVLCRPGLPLKKGRNDGPQIELKPGDSQTTLLVTRSRLVQQTSQLRIETTIQCE